MVETHYRWDFIGLSTDTKPTPATSEKVVDGSTYYTSDDSKLYVWYKNQWYEKEGTGGGTTYTAGENITIADGVISATDTTYSNFTGTDGTAAGAAGLVPAPAVADAGKFLKADGTWGEAGGGGSGVIELTTADYDWNSVSGAAPNGIAMWNMEAGIYHNNTDQTLEFYSTNTFRNVQVYANMSFVITSHRDNDGRKSTVMQKLTGSNNGVLFITSSYNGSSYSYSTQQLLSTDSIDDRLTSSSTTHSLSAKQGKVLNDKITPTSASGAPTTSTAGELGKIYIDTATNDAYMCVNVSGSTYTWKQITA